MAEAEISQEEADALIVMPKLALPDTRLRRLSARVRNGGRPYGIEVVSADPDAGRVFEIHVVANHDIEVVSMSLFAVVPGKPRQPLCRCETQINDHANDPNVCGNSLVVPAGQGHWHRFSAAAIAAGAEWCCCATPFDLPAISFAGQAKSLMWTFLDEIHLTVSEPETLYSMLGARTP